MLENEKQKIKQKIFELEIHEKKMHDKKDYLFNQLLNFTKYFEHFSKQIKKHQQANHPVI